MKELGILIDSKEQPFSNELQEIGIKVGKLYTDHGFPIDMALNKLPYSHMQKVSILDGACSWIIEHKRKSGATEKAIERTRKSNRTMIERFINKKEVGVY
jgi:hypothetical protein